MSTSPRSESRRRALLNATTISSSRTDKAASSSSSNKVEKSCGSSNNKKIVNACRTELKEKYGHFFIKNGKNFDDILRVAVDTTKLFLSLSCGNLNVSEIDDEVLRKTVANNCKHAITNLSQLSKG